MKRNKLITLALIIISIMVVLIIVENSIKGIKNAVTNVRDKIDLEEQQKIYENSEEYKEEVKLTGIVGDFQKLLNEKNLDKIYELIDNDYKDYKFQNKRELFNEYISSYISEDAELTLQTYEKISGRYVCRILSYQNGTYTSFVALIEPNEDESSYSIILDDISAITKKDIAQIDNKGLRVKVLYYVTAENTAIYSVEYTNTGKSEINYEYDIVKLNDSYGNSFEAVSNLEKIALKPGETARQELIFYKNGIHKYVKTYLEFKFKENSIIIDLKETGIEY